VNSEGEKWGVTWRSKRKRRAITSLEEECRFDGLKGGEDRRLLGKEKPAVRSKKGSTNDHEFY